MAYYRTVTYTTTGTKESLDFDPSIVPFNATVACTVVTGPVSYKIQYSLDPMTVAEASATWIDSGDIPAATTTSATSAFQFPVSRIRAVIATLTAGSIQVQCLQGLSTN